jgi:excisionase family DNA binding protein
MIITESSNVLSSGVPSSDTRVTVETADDVRLGRSVSIDQAAQLLRLSRRTIYYRIRDGRLQTIRTIGGSQRVLVESLYASGFRSQAFSTSASAASFALRAPRS